jgi:tetratricopeptide (TPR) repeat protein
MVVSTPMITRRGAWQLGPAVLLLGLLTTAPGCAGGGSILPESWAFWDQHETKALGAPPEDAIVMRDGQLFPDKTGPVLGGDFEAAKQLFQDKQYIQAAPIFCRIADHKKNILKVLEEARWYEAECYYKLARYPDAAPRYIQLLNDFPSAAHGESARQRLFDIANYWLDETREQMEATREKHDGKRWIVWPLQPVHFEDSKPFLDMEGHAVRCLETVWMTDPRGQLGEKALFFLGSLRFYREDWRDADHYFYQLVQNYPNSGHAPQALKLSILCKEIAQGGAAYDGRRLQEARDLIKMAKTSYPELARDEDQFLTKQLVQIHAVEAEKDYENACYWDRTGHPGSAYFCYEIVRRRYPGSTYAEKAAKRMGELKERADRELKKDGPTTPAAPSGMDAPPPPRVIMPGPAGVPGSEPGPAPRALPPSVMDGPPGRN